MYLPNENSCLYKWKDFSASFPKEVKINWAHLNQGYDFLEAYLLTESFSTIIFFSVSNYCLGLSCFYHLPLSISQKLSDIQVQALFKNSLSSIRIDSQVGIH